MKLNLKHVFLFLALAGLWLVDLAPGTPFMPVFVGEAEAIIGMPLTPFSYAGVARRTTRRFVYADAAMTSVAVDSAQAAQAQQAAAAPAQQAPSPQFAAGTTVSALPGGCTSVTRDGGDVFDCGGTYYKPEYKSGNLVYVVQ
jgi:hypothetical protein